MKSEYIVSVEWLNSNLENEKIVVLDASLKPITSKDVNGNEQNTIIPKARKFDLKQVFSNKNSLFDHTLPNPADFVKEMRLLGISDDSIIVIYDNQGVYSSPRAFYMIKSIGHKEVYVLNGGLPEWISKGFNVIEHVKEVYTPGNFSNKSNEPYFYFCDSTQVLNNIDSDEFKIIDARSEKRFLGLELEPRPNLKLGHIPNSKNIPFEKVLDNGKFKDVKELENVLLDNINEDTTLIFSCGSGVTSCITALAAQISGHNNVLVFDGSWSEWGDENSKFPISNPNQ